MVQIYKDLVAYFGGQSNAASVLGVSQGTVSGWVRGVHGCSAEVALHAEKITLGKFSAVELRPSLNSGSSNMSAILEAGIRREKRHGGAVNSSSMGVNC
jgi:DNA-binding transcriptional regulator YdaS (Cro superfamily)